MALSLKGGTRVRLFRFWLELTWPSVVNTAKTPSALRLHFHFWGNLLPWTTGEPSALITSLMLTPDIRTGYAYCRVDANMQSKETEGVYDPTGRCDTQCYAWFLSLFYFSPRYGWPQPPVPVWAVVPRAAAWRNTTSQPVGTSPLSPLPLGELPSLRARISRLGFTI